MSAFDSTKTQLSKLLDEIADGKMQLPDFQRGKANIGDAPRLMLPDTLNSHEHR